MKVNVTVTIIKNPNNTYSARFKSNFRPENDNLKNVKLDDISKYFANELEYADEHGLITK